MKSISAKSNGTKTIRVIVPSNVGTEEASRVCQYAVEESGRVKAAGQQPYVEVLSTTVITQRLLEMARIYASMPQGLRMQCTQYAGAIWGKEAESKLGMLVMVNGFCAPRVQGFALAYLDGNCVCCAFQDGGRIAIPWETLAEEHKAAMAKESTKETVQAVVAKVQAARDAAVAAAAAVPPKHNGSEAQGAPVEPVAAPEGIEGCAK